MGDKITSAGWLIELMRCDHLDDAASNGWYAINLIAPQGGSSTKSETWVEGPRAVCSADEALAALDSLLKPWTWEIVSWAVFSSSDGVNWLPLASVPGVTGVAPVVAASRDGIRAAIVNELVDRTTGCKDAFSLDDPRWMGHPKGEVAGAEMVEQSWPHALVALTHTPAGLSNEVLQFGHFLQLKPAPAAFVVAFPVFKTGGQTFTPQTPTTYPKINRVAAAYDNPYGAIQVVFGTQATPSSPNNLRGSTAASLVEGLKAREIIDGLFVTHLLPAGALGDSLSRMDFSGTAANPDSGLIIPQKFPQAQWQLALLKSIGSGWIRLRMRSGTWARPHVLQFSSKHERLELLVAAYCSPATQPIGEALEKAFGDLAEADTTAFLKEFGNQLPNGALAQAVADMLQAIPDLPSSPGYPELDSRRQAAARFFRAWNTAAAAIVSDDNGTALAASIKARIMLQRATASDPQKGALDGILNSLANRFDAQTSDQLLLGTSDTRNAPSPIWQALSDFVDARGDAPREDKALQKMKAGITSWAKSVVPNNVLPSKFDPVLQDSGTEFRTDFNAKTSGTANRARDEGLWLEFDAAGYGGSPFDPLIRGFALALCGGISSANASEQPFWDTDRAQWITNTAIRYYPTIGPSDLLKLSAGQSPVAWYSGAVGSTVVGAKRMGQATYMGKPLCSILEDTNGKAIDARHLEDTRTFDYRWPIALPDKPTRTLLPFLAYGTEYRGYVTAIDNAGGVVQFEMRSPGLVADLTDATQLPWDHAATFVRYESRVPAGAPRVQLSVTGIADLRPSQVDAAELTSETRALRFVSQQLEERKNNGTLADLIVGASVPRVFALAPRTGSNPANPQLVEWFLADRPAQMQFRVRPPRTYVGFIRSWLAADQLILDSKFSATEKSRALSDPAFYKHPEALAAFRDLVTASVDVSQNTAGDSGYNPTVSGIGIELYYGDSIDQLDPILIARTDWHEDTHELKPSQPVETLTVIADASVASPTVSTVKGQRTLTLPAGRFVRVRFYSLVEDSFFVATDQYGHRLPANSRMRFAPSIGGKQTGKWKDFRSFGPAEYWIESLPNWKVTPAPGTDYFNVSILPPDVTQPELARLVLDTQIEADWIRAVEINRHSWHWTGYPVQFPALAKAVELQRWLPAFAGVESKREKLQTALATRVDVKSGRWLYGDREYAVNPVTGKPLPVATLDTQRLEAGDRPSRYAAYTVRPMVRFRTWLKPWSDRGPRKLEADIFATGNVIPGVNTYSEVKRLPTPAFRYRIPLTATYQYDPNQGGALKLARTNNGSLLIFQDAIRRTDSFSRVGGIGDTVEVDLLQTRTFSIRGAGARPFWEIGPNPIFHPSPAAGLQPGDIQNLKQLTVQASEPHGLTYDLVRNGKVAQTGVLVRAAVRDQHSAGEGIPEDPALRQWMLAKLRARRILLPEAQLNSSIDLDTHTNGYPLPWRRDGLDRIPADIAIDFTSGLAPMSVKIICDGTPYELTVPNVPVNMGLRLLVSFHKGRWDPNQPPSPKGVPYWAPQVMVQRPRKSTASGEEVLGWETIATATCDGKKPWLSKNGQLTLSVAGVNVSRAFVAQVSDYTDPRWVLFIGRIPGTGDRGPEQYVFSAQKNDLGKVEKLVLSQGSFAPLPRPPQTQDQWNGAQVEFYVLLVSAPTTNIMTGTGGSNDVGLLAFQSATDSNNNPIANEFVPLGNIDVLADDLVGASALLCAFQRITSTSQVERTQSIDSFEKLIKAIFPDPLNDGSGQLLESLVRPTGSHWGPMPIGGVISASA